MGGHRLKKGEYFSQETFLERCTKIHGDKYDYSKTEYLGNKHKVKITCKTHGEFKQLPSDHWAGRGCPQCYFDSKKTWTSEQDAFLIENFSKEGVQWCAVKMAKTMASINGRAATLGLMKKQKEWNYRILARTRWQALVDRAAKKPFKIDLTPEFLEELYLKQEGKCALTGWSIIFSDEVSINTASVDRKDSKIGYLQNNVQIVHKWVNLVKNDLTEQEFYKICSAVTKKRASDLASFKTEWVDDYWGDREYPIKVEDTEF